MDANRNTLLHVAVSNQLDTPARDEVIHVLLQHGAQDDVPNDEGKRGATCCHRVTLNHATLTCLAYTMHHVYNNYY